MQPNCLFNLVDPEYSRVEQNNQMYAESESVVKKTIFPVISV